MGDDCLLLPHRVEFARYPSEVDRFFIDGPMEESDLRYVIPEPAPNLASPCPGGSIYLNHLKILTLAVLYLSASQFASPGWQVVTGWMEMLHLFRLLKVRQLLVLPRLFAFISP